MTAIVLLSAGKGKRLGEDKRYHIGSKHTIKLNDETVIERQIRLITETCDYKIYIVAGENENIIKDILIKKYSKLFDSGKISFLKTETNHLNAITELADVCDKLKFIEDDIIVLLGDTVFSKNAIEQIVNIQSNSKITSYVGGKAHEKGTWWDHDGEVFGVRVKSTMIITGKMFFSSITKPFYELKNISKRNIGDKVYVKECCDIDHIEDIERARQHIANIKVY
jgi:choline kinase